MAVRLPSLLAYFSLSLGVCQSQLVNWQSRQINTSICTWSQPRAALVRDTVYLDGGSIWWSAGLDSGQYGPPAEDGNPGGVILTYNLSQPFTPTSNVTGLLLKDSISKAIGGASQGQDSEPGYYDGGMLANDAEFFLYGGEVFSIDTVFKPPAADDILGYRKYNYGIEKPLLKSGFVHGSLSNGVTRYIAYGGAVNAPSENMAWYFSGLTSPSHGPVIFDSGTNRSTAATNVSNTLIELDMTTQLQEKWSNTTLPDKVKGRANSEVVWVPVGKKGILVVLGGVVYPEWATVIHKSENASASEQQSPKFMQSIDIYDVDGKEWYQQPTAGGPGASTRGCAVVSPASDYSSYNIYYYGGFDGIHPIDEYSDQVWVLSLPSFTWTLLNNGTSSHARAGHKCFMPYPDQMMVFGGYTALKGSTITCLENGPIILFNVSSGEWVDSYSPSKYSKYNVPDKVVSVIGGDRSGKATISSPKGAKWSSDSLKSIFETKYDSKKITQWWPYPEIPTSNGTITPTPAPSGDNDSTLKIIIPAVVISVSLLVSISAVIWCVCRKSRNRARGASTTTSDENGRRIVHWLRLNRFSKQFSPTEMDSSETTEVEKGYFEHRHRSLAEGTEGRHEMPDNQVSELFDTSSPAELNAANTTQDQDRGEAEAYVNAEVVSAATDSTRPPLKRTSGNGLPVSRFSGPPISGRQTLESPILGQMGALGHATCAPEPSEKSQYSAGGQLPSGPSLASPPMSPERFEPDPSPGEVVSPLQITMSNEATSPRRSST